MFACLCVVVGCVCVLLCMCALIVIYGVMVYGVVVCVRVSVHDCFL